MQFIASNPQQLSEVARNILAAFPHQRIFLFFGEMGSGKTTLIKAFCRALGVTSSMSSPTFSIINVYDSASGDLYHLDLYRLKSPSELIDLGIEEIISKNNFIFVEWPELMMEIFPDLTAAEIHIFIQSDQQRMIIIRERP
ncbi:MAG: tRNA (adenosine(37)-N6)-threonylcarbamoyltransferase complex ATPase subunit type 1 TsaE [Vicingaceae bacterium]|nr:MAG: tRNA (adenosine(37)-N6)-threonylcarbamoyltransferase complex ATPase subunit type 1 TsaE [Vicingaceae bacterium]